MTGGRKALLSFAWVLVLACGRTGLLGGDADSGGGGEGGVSDQTPVDECTIDADCPRDDACTPGVCHAPDGEHAARFCTVRLVSCDDGDPCTADRCDPDDGRCEHEGGGDSDHDGYRGEVRPGMPAACGGSDCDDDDPRVFPGAPEICDGKDNDCGGGIDEGASYVPVDSPVLIAPNSFKSSASDLVFDGASFAVAYTEQSESLRYSANFELLGVDGAITFGPTRVSEINADSFAGSIATSGKAFFTAWADARQAAGYEIYGTRFNLEAQKLEPDQRLTDAPGYSLNPSSTFVGTGYRVAWEDRRFRDSVGPASVVYGRKTGIDGHADGDEVRLTASDEDSQFPDMARSETRLGVAYTYRAPLLPDGGEPPAIVRFRSFDFEFSEGSGPADLGDGQQPAIVRTDETFVVAWHTGDTMTGPGSVLQAAVLDEQGNVRAVGAITTGDARAKTRSVVSLGDRVLVVWSAKATEDSPFQLYYEIISATDLSVVTSRQQLTLTMSNLEDPSAQLGPNGDVGVVFTDKTTQQAYFTHLGCKLGTLPGP